MKDMRCNREAVKNHELSTNLQYPKTVAIYKDLIKTSLSFENCTCY